jgi:hypothetical protein
MITFTKKELGFIGLYNLCIDNKSPLHDKFEIKCNKEETIILQESDACTLITMFNKKNEEESETIYSTAKVNSILSFVPDSDIITFTEKGMSFNKSTYDFEEDKINLNDISELLTLIENKSYVQRLSFKNLKTMSSVKGYVGQEGLDTIANMNGSFVASNEMGISAIVKSENQNTFYIPEILVNMIMFKKLDEIEIDVYDNFVSTKIEDTYVIVPTKEYLIPNIFEEEFANKYNHKDIITLGKEELVKAVQRIKVVASFNIYSRIFIYCFENYIEIVSKDNSKAVETVNAKVDKDLIGHYFIISANYLFQIANSLEGKNIIIHALNDKELEEQEKAVAVKITDETENKFFIHCLYPDLEVN